MQYFVTLIGKLATNLNTLPSVQSKLEQILNYKLIELGSYKLSLWSIISVLLLFLVVTTLLKLIKRSILKNKRIDQSKRYTIYVLSKYAIVTMCFVWAMHLLGMNVTLFLGGSAAILVGVGLGLQNLFADFVSGLILLVDSSIKIGDIIEVDGLTCRVVTINLRTTQVLTRDDKTILLPNSKLTQNNIINWTHNAVATRFDIQVGVGYDSDAHLVKRLLLEIVNAQEGVLKSPEPFVRFNNFDDSSLSFSLNFWCIDPFRVEKVKSEIRFKIFDTFNKYHIDIPLPQRVVHKYEMERGDDFKRYTADDFLE